MHLTRKPGKSGRRAEFAVDHGKSDRLLAAESWPAVGQALTAAGQRLLLIEAGAGGAVMQSASAAPGASAWLEGGILCYADSLKTGLLGLPQAVLDAHGAVSAEAVAGLAQCGLALSRADWVLVESGVYGPAGGSPEKPVGLVYLHVAGPHGVAHTHRLQLSGSRPELRTAVADNLARALLERLRRTQDN